MQRNTPGARTEVGDRNAAIEVGGFAGSPSGRTVASPVSVNTVFGVGTDGVSELWIRTLADGTEAKVLDQAGTIAGVNAAPDG